ncbi:MAG: hypothetical protein JXB14_03860 [Candidatus Altiarchaeota archaeon]|nr:hypothetical protein [Candidatus Altiarchaeota archaeon]
MTALRHGSPHSFVWNTALERVRMRKGSRRREKQIGEIGIQTVQPASHNELPVKIPVVRVAKHDYEALRGAKPHGIDYTTHDGKHHIMFHDRRLKNDEGEWIHTKEFRKHFENTYWRYYWTQRRKHTLQRRIKAAGTDHELKKAKQKELAEVRRNSKNLQKVLSRALREM